MIGASRTTQSLPVDGDLVDVELGREVGGPLGQTASELLRIQGGKDSLKGVVRGNAMGQSDELLEPVETLFGEGFDLKPIISPTNDRTNGDEDDVAEQVP